MPFGVELSSAEGFEYFGGLEELTDYELINADQGSSKKRKVKDNVKVKKKKIKSHNKNKELEEINVENSEKDADMSAWCNCFVPEQVLKALKELSFYQPTKIQELAIPPAIRDHQDILGAAETGSGKTLAFGIPIIGHIISKNEHQPEATETKPLHALVLTPTRELAIQVMRHLQAICKYTDIKVAVVVGGMAPEKQKRLLRGQPDIVVATPGRLWELFNEGDDHLAKVPAVKYLVIDEADRMMEKGHFKELTQILSLIKGDKTSGKRQTFIFSATLTLVHEAPQRLLLKSKKKVAQKQKLESFIELIGMKEKPRVIDITQKTALVDTLTESQIICSTIEKDVYLYYFVRMCPGRTLVFCNSIDCVRRLRTVLENLELSPLVLHASMHQKQRLRNLDAFVASSQALLLATDVAARGLDIQGIQHVIHFQVPHTAEIYVHRSGRTARARNEGFSLMLIDPQDAIYYKRICKTLNKEKALPPFPIDYNVFKILKEHVHLAREIDKTEHRQKRLQAQNRWFTNAAKEMEIDLEDDLLHDMGTSAEQAAKNRQIKAMKKQLKALLGKKIIPQKMTSNYPTKLGKLMTPPAYGTGTAIEIAKGDLDSKIKRSKRSRRKKKRACIDV